MCSEGDYRQCHRHNLIGRTLQNDGLTLHHILSDGSLEASGPEVWYNAAGTRLTVTCSASLQCSTTFAGGAVRHIRVSSLLR